MEEKELRVKYKDKEGLYLVYILEIKNPWISRASFKTSLYY
jgi:hypothetical protein